MQQLILNLYKIWLPSVSENKDAMYFLKPNSYAKEQFTPKFLGRNMHLFTICSFWLIKQVDKSIEPLAGILGNGCDSSQHHRTSRTNSIQSTAIADNM